MTPTMPHLDELLEKTSRTFALSIPLLPEPTRNEVTVAYLLFRIADTFEDAASWPRERRTAALDAFAELLQTPSPAAAEKLASRWSQEAPSSHHGYLELLEETPFVLRRFLDLEPLAQQLIRDHTLRTADLMARFVNRTNQAGELELEDISDLQEYCYAVAGIVGEMLTELFLRNRETLQPVADYLRQRARQFGEGLQLTNILKDASVDAREGRGFLPREVDRAEVFDLARRDLQAATEYTLALQEGGAPRGVVAFNALNLLLARGTLNRVQERGAGAKLTRPEVFAILAGIQNALDNDQPVIPRPETVSQRNSRSVGSSNRP